MMRLLLTFVSLAATQAVPLEVVGPFPTTAINLEVFIHDKAPEVSTRTRRHVVSLVSRYCAPSDWRHILAIGLVESRYRPNVVSETGDYGMWQINAEAHGTIEGLEAQTRFACKLLRRAKERGSVGYYHSGTPKHRRSYEQKIERALKYVTR